jgi:hypothetical protein
MPGRPTGYASGSFLLNLDGVKAGFVKSMEGGAVSAEVVGQPVGPDYFVKKHLGQPKYEDFSLQIGLSLAKSVYDWITASWKGNYQRKDGSLVAADFNLNAESEREFFHALITETTIPACDASSKDPVSLTLKFRPEYTRYKKASGKVSAPIGKGEQKQWLPSSFRLEIDGLDCTKVSKVDAFTVKQPVLTTPVGDARSYLAEPGKLDFPNLRITLPRSASQTWRDWFDDFVVKGNSGDDKEKTGSLTFLTPDRKTELLKLRFFGLGIFKLASPDREPLADQLAKLVAGLYCERMEFIHVP